MVVVGADVHKRTPTFVAVNEAGRKLGEKTDTAITAGHAEALMWAGQGSSTPKALRCLKRRLACVVFGHLRTDHNKLSSALPKGSGLT
ncbi:transposase [Mycobacterium xenopi]|uniref:Transposase n=1 Tax=Mycobacterium xenopi TaxID=1789 RepID=A0AAD1LZ49_MYCXE|nr:hypothetical protein MYXE_01960 [Mycobacterium xenopi]SPX79668.1 transposase [Mycobacterium xenopi]